MKTVFKSDEIAHIWANRGAPHGRSPGNLSFNGDAIKSYATVIGRRISHKGREAYVLDQASFSVTTSGAQRHVADAIPDSAKVFHVHCGSFGQALDFTAATLRDYYLGEFRDMGEGKPARMKAKRAQALLHRYSRLDSALDVCRYFGLPAAKLQKLRIKAGPELTAARTLADEYTDGLREKREARWEAQRKAREQRQAQEIAQAIALAEAICAGRQPFTGKEHFGHGWSERPLPLLESRPDLVAGIQKAQADFEASKLARWLAGDDVSLGYNCPTLLRVEGDEMVTSHGARVPLQDARRTYRFALACRAKGWHRNGEQHAIGAYQLDAVNENGVVAGCHRVTWAEIERFATAQGWQGGAK